MDAFRQADRRGIAANPGESYDYPYPWVNLGSLSSAIVTPAVGARKRSDIVTLLAVPSVLELVPPNNEFDDNTIPTEPNGAKAYEVRFRSSGANDEAYVVDAITANAPIATEHYTRRATLTGTQGLQPGTAGFFHDSIVGSNEAWLTAPAEVKPATGGNYIGSYLLTVHGSVSIVFVPTTIPSGTLYIDVRRFS